MIINFSENLRFEPLIVGLKMGAGPGNIDVSGLPPPPTPVNFSDWASLYPEAFNPETMAGITGGEFAITGETITVGGLPSGVQVTIPKRGDYTAYPGTPVYTPKQLAAVDAMYASQTTAAERAEVARQRGDAPPKPKAVTEAYYRSIYPSVGTEQRISTQLTPEQKVQEKERTEKTSEFFTKAVSAYQEAGVDPTPILREAAKNNPKIVSQWAKTFAIQDRGDWLDQKNPTVPELTNYEVVRKFYNIYTGQAKNPAETEKVGLPKRIAFGPVINLSGEWSAVTGSEVALRTFWGERGIPLNPAGKEAFTPLPVKVINNALKDTTYTEDFWKEIGKRYADVFGKDFPLKDNLTLIDARYNLDDISDIQVRYPWMSVGDIVSMTGTGNLAPVEAAIIAKYTYEEIRDGKPVKVTSLEDCIVAGVRPETLAKMGYPVTAIDKAQQFFSERLFNYFDEDGNFDLTQALIDDKSQDLLSRYFGETPVATLAEAIEIAKKKGVINNEEEFSVNLGEVWQDIMQDMPLITWPWTPGKVFGEDLTDTYINNQERLEWIDSRGWKYEIPKSGRWVYVTEPNKTQATPFLLKTLRTQSKENCKGNT